MMNEFPDDRVIHFRGAYHGMGWGMGGDKKMSYERGKWKTWLGVVCLTLVMIGMAGCYNDRDKETKKAIIG